MILLRAELGDVLRSARLRRRLTLREVASEAKVSLGYLSEVERGQKEASSELLASICEALDLPMWATMREVSDRMAAAESSMFPDSLPPEFTVEASRLVGAVR
ncbi:MAG: helix-turn-helix domain-containing protein [Bifidobacteriaceae bacterium]|jgi:transcriptional regulator with XRE-family HTH domain|nr:helix-turn-helix domain-containing protein [Bifidobacteriaceae bacterium]